jgi:hypothetical protein
VVFAHACKMGLERHRVEAARLALPFRPVLKVLVQPHAGPPRALRQHGAGNDCEARRY